MKQDIGTHVVAEAAKQSLYAVLIGLFEYGFKATLLYGVLKNA